MFAIKWPWPFWSAVIRSPKLLKDVIGIRPPESFSNFAKPFLYRAYRYQTVSVNPPSGVSVVPVM
jgi:hypothetical protein